MSTDRIAQPARASTPLPPDLLAEVVENVLARLKQARPRLEGRIDRAATYLTVQLSTSAKTRPIKCRIRQNGRRVYLVASLTSGGVTYEVSPADWRCSCPDFHRHGTGCKHSLAAWTLFTADHPLLSAIPTEIASKASEEAAQDDDKTDGHEPAEASASERKTADGPSHAEVEAWLKMQKWITAKTRPDNPHQYCLKRNAGGPEMFDDVVRFIQERGDVYRWWGADYRQLVANRHAHWSMSGPGQAILINRKDLEQVRKDELRNRGGGGIQWRWLHGDLDEDRSSLRREEKGQDELTGGGA